VLFGGGGGEPVEEAGVDGGAFVGEALPVGVVRRLNDLEDGEVEFGGEGEVAVVVGGDGHDGSGAVAHHDVVGDPDGDWFVIDWVDGEGAGEDAGFVFIEIAAVHVGLGGAGLDVGGDGGELFW